MGRAPIEYALEELNSGKNAVIATIIRTLGSTPQKIGAQILIKSDKSIVGTIGGGCVEGDVWFNAINMLNTNEHFKIHEYTLNEDIAAEDGLTCGGTAQFMLESIGHSKSSLKKILPRIVKAKHGGGDITTVTPIKLPPKSNLKVGQHFIIDDNQSQQVGTLSEDDNAMLTQIRQTIVPQIKANHSIYVKPENSGYEMFLTVHSMPTTLLVLGAGHVGKAITDLAAGFLSMRVMIIDDREEFAHKQRFPNAVEVLAGDFSEKISDLPVRNHWNILIVTRGHRHDLAALLAALDTNAEYIGLMGSKRKGILLRKELITRGYTEAQLSRLHTPMGLDIGAVTPQEIAMSVISEIIARNSGNAKELPTMDTARLKKIQQSAKA